MKTAKTFWMDRTTTRGWIALWSVIIIAAIWLTYITRDVCYIGGVENLGYGSCTK